MKLLFVHDHPFYQDSDGNVYTGGSFPQNIWNNYLLNFTNVTVFGRKSTSEKSKNSMTSGLSNVSFSLTKNYDSIISLFRNNVKLRAELKALINDSDIVLARLPSILGFIAISEATKLNKPIWVEQVGNSKETFNTHGSLSGRISAELFESINKYLIRKASFVSYVTDNKLQQDYPIEKNVISVSLSNVIINNILTDNELDNKRFYGDIISICLIGGFDVRYKGQDVLLKAIAGLPKDITSKIELNFIGKGDFNWVLNKAKKLGIRDNIKFIGPVKAGDEINNFLSNMSLYVQPSLTEGMPRATIEAMSMGCPVIGSKAGGIPDIVNSDLLHEKGDFKKLRKDILYLLRDRDFLHKEATNSLFKAENYHISVLTERRTTFYKKMNEFIIELN
ncbi:glycosyltransferase [Psychrobacter sp. GP33]|uniref:glycosyltransferase n=1 Tax=Psychrobacter sp. GP33 TaxID=2758709 RepID=UPI0015F9D9CE|nr:glycosyltransferase [Psychrobacter sp. GP33]